MHFSTFKPKSHSPTLTTPDKVKERSRKKACLYFFRRFVCSTFHIWATTLRSERWNSFLTARLLLKGRGKRGESFGEFPRRSMATYLRDRDVIKGDKSFGIPEPEGDLSSGSRKKFAALLMEGEVESLDPRTLLVVRDKSVRIFVHLKPKSHYPTLTNPNKVKDRRRKACIYFFAVFCVSTYPIWATTLSSERWNSFLRAQLLLKGRGKRGQIFGDSPETDGDISSGSQEIGRALMEGEVESLDPRTLQVVTANQWSVRSIEGFGLPWTNLTCILSDVFDRDLFSGRMFIYLLKFR
ncbi:hypothetical protein CEXT_310911 [Caerostris extrusa]|uniref:Uncharacterized protein n=1 Tax=Caerostris extrusa TaxID=172846 RepID=A0AAV4WZ48_CAEEX|nr:hypothetical protein CEXT_310911 [Caerostris extrusa]